MDLEKLTLSKKKCHNVHVGKNEVKCKNLRVHDTKMSNSKQETYLGDKIDKSGLLKPTIQSRIGKGYGAVSTILAIVNEVPLGHWRVEAGLRLREAMLINGTLFNSEAWQGISQKDVEELEKVDEALLRGLLQAHSKVPKEALHLETGTIAIRHILKSRRLCYLQNILKRDSEELVREIYDAQKNDPVDGDYYQLVQADAEDIDLHMTEAQIVSMKEEEYKAKVKSKVRIASFNYLMQLKTNHTKMDGLNYHKLEMTNYLRSPLFNSDSLCTLFSLRTRTVRGIKNDFRGMYADVLCPLGCDKTDTIPHILECISLQQNMNSQDIVNSTVKYEDIFSPEVIKQKQVTELYIQLLEIRDRLMNSPPVAQTGPVH